jgi:hypothetical protein
MAGIDDAAVCDSTACRVPKLQCFGSAGISEADRFKDKG